MYDRILVPLDGSKLALGVISYVRSLAHALEAPVELLFVNDPSHLAPSAQGRDFMDDAASSFSGIAAVRCTIESGNPADVIVDLARAQPRTLVAMATHGCSGPKRWLLGSVAEKVLHGLASDMLLVRPEEVDGGAVQLKTLLAPLDGSESAEKVLPTVLELAKRLGAEVSLVHVTKRVYSGPPDAFLPVFGAIPNLKELWEQDKAAANKYLTEKVAQLRARGLANISSTVIEGGVDGAAAEIIDLAQKHPGSLITMTSHGQSGIGRWLIGSVTERVVRHSKRPVLVVRPHK